MLLLSRGSSLRELDTDRDLMASRMMLNRTTENRIIHPPILCVATRDRVLYLGTRTHLLTYYIDSRSTRSRPRATRVRRASDRQLVPNAGRTPGRCGPPRRSRVRRRRPRRWDVQLPKQHRLHLCAERPRGRCIAVSMLRHLRWPAGLRCGDVLSGAHLSHPRAVLHQVERHERE